MFGFGVPIQTSPSLRVFSNSTLKLEDAGWVKDTILEGWYQSGDTWMYPPGPNRGPPGKWEIFVYKPYILYSSWVFMGFFHPQESQGSTQFSYHGSTRTLPLGYTYRPGPLRVGTSYEWIAKGRDAAPEGYLPGHMKGIPGEEKESAQVCPPWKIWKTITLSKKSLKKRSANLIKVLWE